MRRRDLLRPIAGIVAVAALLRAVGSAQATAADGVQRGRDESGSTGAAEYARAGPRTRRRVRRWLKGQTHAHTNYSDGDSPPETVADWYAAHGYDFLFLTDHNVLIPEDHLATLQRGRRMPVWQGEEITLRAAHINGLGVTKALGPRWPSLDLDDGPTPATPIEAIGWAVARILEQGAVAQINHPNFPAPIPIAHLLGAGGFALLEIANALPGMKNAGIGEYPSTEAIWDALLAAGRRVWGVASDDAHNFKVWGPQLANPGRGWLRVDAEAFHMGEVLDALRAGQFYASTGLELGAYEASASRLTLELDTGPARIELIGQGGTVLDVVTGDRARFQLGSATGTYARARVSSPDGRQLWTQPLFR